MSNVALSLVLAVLTSQEPSSELKPGKGRELVQTACTQCHTAQNILATHVSRKTWDTMITWMQETQGLAELEPDVRAQILDYLETTQGLVRERVVRANATPTRWGGRQPAPDRRLRRRHAIVRYHAAIPRDRRWESRHSGSVRPAGPSI